MHARGESSAAKAPRRTAKITPCALVAAAATSRARACSRSQPPFCTSCRAETNAQCCRGSYKECEAFSQLPNCQDCCVSHAKETCTRNHSQICQCGVQKWKSRLMTMWLFTACMLFGCTWTVFRVLMCWKFGGPRVRSPRYPYLTSDPCFDLILIEKWRGRRRRRRRTRDLDLPDIVYPVYRPTVQLTMFFESRRPHAAIFFHPRGILTRLRWNEKSS